jgi:hypothetical protein
MSHQMPNLYFFSERHARSSFELRDLFAGRRVGIHAVQRIRCDKRSASVAALGYGVAMALTFDEFGMWLHLGGSYWQRASVDAVIIVAAVLALIGFATGGT